MESAEIHLINGVEKYLYGQLQDAVKELSKAIEINPNLTDAYDKLGNVYFELIEYEKAIDNYTKALELEENSAELLFERGEAKFLNGNWIGARIDFENASKLNKGLEVDFFLDQINIVSMNAA